MPIIGMGKNHTYIYIYVLIDKYINIPIIWKPNIWMNRLIEWAKWNMKNKQTKEIKLFEEK